MKIIFYISIALMSLFGTRFLLVLRDAKNAFSEAEKHCVAMGGKLLLTTCVKKDVILDNKPYSE